MGAYTKIMTRRKEIKLKLEEGDTRMLNKVLKWAGSVIDCRAMLKQGASFPQEKFKEIEETISTNKKLHINPEIAEMAKEFVKIHELQGKIDKLG